MAARPLRSWLVWAALAASAAVVASGGCGLVLSFQDFETTSGAGGANAGGAGPHATSATTGTRATTSQTTGSHATSTGAIGGAAPAGSGGAGAAGGAQGGGGAMVSAASAGGAGPGGGSTTSTLASTGSNSGVGVGGGGCACVGVDTACATIACKSGACAVATKVPPTPPDRPGDCRALSCNGVRLQESVDASDAPLSASECELGTCTPAGTPTTAPIVTGQVCGNMRTCNGPLCTGCSMDGDCPVTQTCSGYQCKAGSCMFASTICDAVTCVDGVEFGSGSCLTSICALPAPKVCEPYICGNGLPPGCTTTCATSADCAVTGYCSGTSCVRKNPSRASCMHDEHCLSGRCSAGSCE